MDLKRASIVVMVLWKCLFFLVGDELICSRIISVPFPRIVACKSIPLEFSEQGYYNSVGLSVCKYSHRMTMHDIASWSFGFRLCLDCKMPAFLLCLN